MFAFCTLSMVAQEVKDFTFTHIGLQEGAYSQRIYSIVQTDDHAVWWATKGGIDRYNGSSIRSYRLGDSDTKDSGGRTIKLKRYLTRDSLYRLMAFDDKGRLYEFDPVHDRFHQTADIRTLLTREVLLYDVEPTSQGFWIATFEGIYFLNGQQITTVMKGVTANCIINTGSGLLFGTKEGLLAYRQESGRQPQTDSRMQVVMTDAVECGYYDRQGGCVWLGCFQGAVKVLPVDAKGVADGPSVTVQMNGIENHPVRSFCPYNDKTMLVGIDGVGVWSVSRDAKDTGRLLFDANDGPNGVLHGNGIYSVITDSWGSIVIGSYSGGIDVARPVGSTPAIFRHARGTDQSLLNDRVNCVAQMENGDLVMGTDNGVSIYDCDDREWKHVCRGIVVTDFCGIGGGRLLAATYGDGVYELSKSGARRLYAATDGLLRDNYVYSLCRDRSGRLWMGCLDGDLVEVAGGYTRYYKLNNVHDITQLPDGRIAVGTAYGVWTVEPRAGEVGQLSYQTSDNAPVNLYVKTLFVNDNKQLWIGTDGGGVYVYDLVRHQATRISAADGLPSDFVCSITCDRFGRILIATDLGLAFVSQETPREVVNVNYCYGLYREYSDGAVCSLSDGNILYGSTTGALVVKPDNIQKINYSARLHLLGLSCKNNDDELFHEQVFRMLRQRCLFLKYSQRTFDLNFEAINLRNQYDIAYQYQMGKGDWSQSDDHPSIRFTNLEPGSHVLRLRCVSRSCGAVLDELLIDIHISQPWWNSWWMWVIYISLAVLAFWGVWRIYNLHAKYMRLVVSTSEWMNAEATDGKKADTDETHTDADEECEPAEDSGSQAPQTVGAQFVERATAHVLAHLSDSSFSIDSLCREMAMSRTLFYVRLKSYTGQSPQDFVRIIRLERAAAMLRSGRSVTDTAALTGFENPKYFSTVFKKYFGTSPSKYN